MSNVNMLQIFKLGDVVGGYCNGYFDRDNYEPRTCVMVTRKYAVFEYNDGTATVLNYFEGLENIAKGDSWKPLPEWEPE